MARYDIGGMLARSGQAQGQQIASGFQQFGTGLGSMLTGVGTGLASRRERKDKEAAAQEAQALLQKYANNPAQLNALGQKYATEGNDALSKLFLDAAKTANQRQVAVLEEAGAQITATTEAARKKGQLRDALMAAREREDTNAVRALSNRSMSASEYLKSLATKTPEKTEYDYSEETIMVDGKPTRVQVGVSKTDPNDRIINTIGEAVPSKEGAGQKTLKEQLEDAGITDVDLTTLKGAKKAQRDIITTTGNASLANAVGQIVDDLTPLPTKEAFDLIRTARPEFSTAESLREQSSRFASLSELSSQDVAGLSALVERTLTATTENDIKAVAELERFRKAKDLPQRIKDFALELTSGRLSEETMNEYSLIMSAFEELASKRMSDAIDNVIAFGTPKEIEAATRVRNMTFGPSSARIIE